MNEPTENLILNAAIERLMRVYPMPWVLYQRNHEGVIVKDNRGDVVFCAYRKDHGDPAFIPFEDQRMKGAAVLAEFLVEVSQLGK